MNERINRIEEKIAYLERHVVEQDKAMLELAEDLARLHRELKAVRERSATGAVEASDSGGPPAGERPPHY